MCVVINSPSDGESKNNLIALASGTNKCRLEQRFKSECIFF